MWQQVVESRGLTPNHVVLGCMVDVLVRHSSVDEAVALGAKIAALGRPSATMCKEAVNAAYERVLEVQQMAKEVAREDLRRLIFEKEEKRRLARSNSTGR